MLCNQTSPPEISIFSWIAFCGTSILTFRQSFSKPALCQVRVVHMTVQVNADFKHMMLNLKFLPNDLKRYTRFKAWTSGNGKCSFVNATESWPSGTKPWTEPLDRAHSEGAKCQPQLCVSKLHETAVARGLGFENFRDSLEPRGRKPRESKTRETCSNKPR